jgi:pimeloyl-ACP methyl ester carboxylesterase
MIVALVLAAAALVLTLAAGWGLARWYVTPKRRPAADASDDSVPRERVSFAVSGLRLDGWYIAPAGSPTPCAAVALVHGWSANGAQMRRLAAELHQAGFGALYFDARGHGTSDRHGPVTIATFAEDIRAALRYLASRADVDTTRLALVGHSLGGAAAILVAARAGERQAGSEGPALRALVSSAAFAHPRAVTRRFLRHLHLPTWPLQPVVCRVVEGWLGRSLDELAPQARIGEIRVPLLLVHGEEDRFVPAADFAALASRADPRLTERWLVPGRGHGGVLTCPQFGPRVVEFLTRHLEAAADLPGSRQWMGGSRSVRAGVAGIAPAPPGSCSGSAPPCDGGRWSDRSRGVQTRRRGSGTAPASRAPARR